MLFWADRTHLAFPFLLTRMNTAQSAANVKWRASCGASWCRVCQIHACYTTADSVPCAISYKWQVTTRTHARTLTHTHIFVQVTPDTSPMFPLEFTFYFFMWLKDVLLRVFFQIIYVNIYGFITTDFLVFIFVFFPLLQDCTFFTRKEILR